MRLQTTDAAITGGRRPAHAGSSVAIIPRFVPLVVAEGQGGRPLLNETHELLGNARPGEKAAGLVRAHPRKPRPQPRMPQYLDDRDAEVLAIKGVRIQGVAAEREG